MKWKKGICFLAVLGSLFIWATFANVWAGEKELIELLKKKNIITQEEADQLLEEVKTTATKEKTEIKKELKTEIQDDIKKDVAKGEYLPPALKGFKFGTTIYADWESINRYSGNNANTNQFALNRAYVTLTKDVNDWLGMNFTSDVFSSRDPNDAVNGLELRVKYAFANVKLFGTETMVGMVPTPSDYYDSSIWPYRVQSANFLDGLGILSTADLGVVNTGAFGGYMDEEYLKYAAKPFAGKWGGYMVGLYNGSGFDTPESNNNKVVSGLLYVRPFPNVAALKGLQLAYFGSYGQSNTNFSAANGDAASYPNWEVNMGQVSYQHPYFTIMGQYYWGKGTKASNEENNRTGYQASAFMRIPGAEKLRVFGKWYGYDPNTDRADDDYRVYVAGLSYDVSPEFMPFVAWEHRDNRINAGAVDYNKYQVGFQLKF
ncbi:MAG: hypothetical protein PHN75_06260 [Syntrophales bacterium]|nr:hypothetical protein [Syntrophales bacterium]